MARPVAVKKTTVNRRLIAGLTLLVALILTVVFLALGITGRNMDAQGLYKLLPWLPVPTEGTLWRDALVPGAGLGDTLTLSLTPAASAADPAPVSTDLGALNGAARVIARRLNDLGWTDSAAVVAGGSVVVTLPRGADETFLREIVSSRGEYAFADPSGQVFLTGDHITSAGYGYADATGQNYALNFVFDTEGARIFGEKSTELIGRNIAILRDGVTLADPSISEPLTGGSVSVPGFGLDDARENAVLMRSGALPLALSIQSDGVRGTALLGSAAQNALIISLIVLVAIASFYLIWRFRLAGAVAVWMLVLQVALSYFFAALIGAGFTLLTLAAVWVPFLVSFFAFVNLLGAAQADLNRGRSIRQALKESHAGRGHASLDVFAGLILVSVVLIIMEHGVIRIFAEVFAVSLLTALTLTHLVGRLALGEAVHLFGSETRLYTPARSVRKEA